MRRFRNIVEVKASIYEWVDLGLPSGLLWATTNVGATKPEEYGLYFAWGETQGYTAEDVRTGIKQFSWGSYKLCNGTSKTLTKYNINSSYGIIDNLTTLELVDDASYISDGTCRMPTNGEWRELIANTTSIVETLNGVDGRRFTSKTNGNSIFIPITGMCSYNTVYDNDPYSYYWSSTLYEDDPSLGLNFKPGPDYGFNIVISSYSAAMSCSDRCNGLSVRAVKSIN